MTSNVFDLAMQEYSRPQEVEQPAIKETPNEIGSNDPAEIESSPFNLAEQIYLGKKDEDWLQNAQRNVSRTAASMVSTLFGIPKGVHEFGKAIGIESPLSGLLDKLPSTQDIRSRIDTQTQGLTVPRSSGEEVSDEVFSTFTNLMTGGTRAISQGASRLPPALRSIANLSRKLGMSVGAEAAKEGVKLYGGGETAQELSKMGSLLLMGLTLPRLSGEANPTAYLENIYKERDALIPSGTMVTPTGLQNNIQNFLTKLSATGPTPAKNQAIGPMREFLNQISDRAVSMEDMIEMYRNVNRNRAGVMAKDIGAQGAREGRRIWGEFANMFNESIEGNLGAISPQALSLHRNAQSGWETLLRSQTASQYIMDKLKNKPLQTGIASLFGGGIFYNPTAALSTASAAAGSAGLVKGTEMAYRFMQNPTLRRYYMDVVNNALVENAAGTTKALKSLDDAYAKELKDPSSSVHRQLPMQGQSKAQQLAPKSPLRTETRSSEASPYNYNNMMNENYPR